MYGDDFYDTIRDGCRDSARAVTDYLAPHLTAESIVDVGCGEGWWGCTLADEFGAEVLGVDGPGVPDHAPIRVRRFKQVDLRRRLDVGRFDLAVCLEVAEHLPPSRAASFVADLCAAAPVVVFSAAIPGQGGTGHLNEQWPGRTGTARTSWRRPARLNRADRRSPVTWYPMLGYERDDNYRLVSACTGEERCRSQVHDHGCFADTDGAACRSPEEHQRRTASVHA